MGDWRQVRIVGTFLPEEGKRVNDGIIEQSEYIPGESFADSQERRKRVSFSVNALLYGTNDWWGWLRAWEDGAVDDTFQLHERNFDPVDIERDLQSIAVVAPSFRLAVHCGGEYQQAHCIATVHLDEGRVWIGPPDVPFVGGDIPESLAAALLEPVRGWLNRRTSDQLENWEIDRLCAKEKTR